MSMFPGIAYQAYRKFKRALLRGVFAVMEIGPRAKVEVTLLAGDLDGSSGTEALAAAGQMARTASVQVLGFRFGRSGSGGGKETARGFDVVELEGGGFPGFHRTLAQALARIGGARLVVFDAGLPGLGLGLLANYHFRTPLFCVGRAEGAGEPSDADWNDPEFLDPTSVAWRRLLADILEEVPRVEVGGVTLPAGDAAALPGARRFAEAFAGFYEKTRSRP